MAVVHHIFGFFEPYSTEDLEQANDSAYYKQIDSVFEELKSHVKEEREFDSNYDPLDSILIVPRNLRTAVTVISLRADDAKQDLIDMIQLALQKVKEMDNY